MASSIQSFGDKVKAFNDFDLIALLCLLQNEVANRPEAYSALMPLLATWKRDLAGYGPGVIDLHLDDLGSSDTARRELRILIEVLDKRIRNFGGSVPASLLNELCSIPGIRFNDYKSIYIRTAIKDLLELIQGE